MKDPVPVEHVRASAGLDIGCTLIGMHLKEVAVPLRLAVKHIGEAPVSAARTRPKLIGGVRACTRKGVKKAAARHRAAAFVIETKLKRSAGRE